MLIFRSSWLLFTTYCYFSPIQTGTLKYCGPAEFATGVWAGIELDEAAGKNDGSVGGISYFKCPPNYGENRIFHF